MKRLSPLGEFSQASLLESLGEGIEQRPDGFLLEFLMPWLTPFMENGGDQPVAAHPHIGRTNDEVMRQRVGDVPVLIAIKPDILVMPLLHQTADAALDQVWQITDNEPCVFACQLDLP